MNERKWFVGRAAILFIRAPLLDESMAALGSASEVSWMAGSNTTPIAGSKMGDSLAMRALVAGELNCPMSRAITPLSRAIGSNIG